MNAYNGLAVVTMIAGVVLGKMNWKPASERFPLEWRFLKFTDCFPPGRHINSRIPSASLKPHPRYLFGKCAIAYPVDATALRALEDVIDKNNCERKQISFSS